MRDTEDRRSAPISAHHPRNECSPSPEYAIKEEFQQLWDYKSPSWAGKFLDEWCRKVMRSRIEPMKKIARSMRGHRKLILNWFEAKGAISAGPVEGLNNKLKVTFRKAYGIRGGVDSSV